MSELGFFSYSGEAITSAATAAAGTAEDLVSLVGTSGPGLATATGSLATVAALRRCAGTWTGRVGVLGEDVRQLSERLTGSLAGYQQIDDELAAALDRIAVW